MLKIGYLWIVVQDIYSIEDYMLHKLLLNVSSSENKDFYNYYYYCYYYYYSELKEITFALTGGQ